ncbi:MAG: phage major capsid protein [Ferruginibacter sp.]
MEITGQISDMKSELVGKIGEFKSGLEELREGQRMMQTQVDAIDIRGREVGPRAGGGGRTLFDIVNGSPEFKAFAETGFRSKHGCQIEVPDLLTKATLTNVGLGFATSGVLSAQRIDGVIPLARQALRVTDLLTHRKVTTGSQWDALRQTTRTNAASPQVEAALKGESVYAWDTISGKFRTIAHFTHISQQALSDSSWLADEINRELMFGLLLKLETEVLFGDNLGDHLNGINTQATAYDSATYNAAGDTRLDKLRHGLLQSTLAGKGSFPPDAIVVHPTDMHTIELIKDQASNVGNYVVGNPVASTQVPVLWGLPVIQSDSMTAGTFLVGPFRTGVVLLDRMEATIEFSRENDLNWVKNLVTALAELRVGLAVLFPTGFIRGSY